MSDRTWPAELSISPLATPPNTTMRVPGSKSITNRALALAAVGSAVGPCELTGALHSEDTELMVAALGRMGYPVEADWPAERIRVRQSNTHRPSPTRLHLGNSGTSLRFLTALAALGDGTFHLDGIARMRERPVQDLLDALNELGSDARSELGTGCPPVEVRASGLAGGTAQVRCDTSSQYLSALLLVAPHARKPVELIIDDELVSEPYILMTLAMLWHWGYRYDDRGVNRYIIHPQTPSQPREYAIEGDASAASYWYAAAAVTSGRITVPNVPANGLQGDVAFVDLLVTMGCHVGKSSSGVTVTGGALHGIEADMNAISDTVMTLAAIAPFARGPTTIRNVAHIRHKETDRIAAVATELRKLGQHVEEFADGLRIEPRPIVPARIQTYNDHRMAMAFALIGLRVPGIVIENPGCVVKTYPTFFDELQKMRSSS